MSLYTLPDDILLSILDHTSWTEDREDDFKQRFNLLTVFHRLRSLALPKIYSHVYVTFNTRKMYKRQNYANKYTKAIPEFIDTNADIIALANCTPMAKSVRIYIYGLSTTCVELHSCIITLQACDNVWPNMAELFIGIFCQNPFDVDERYSEHFSKESKKYSQALTTNMPGVVKLSLLGDLDFGIHKFFSQVACDYASQLTLFATDGFDYAGSHKFEVMQHLCLNMSRYKMIPCVNIHTLVELRIDNIPYNASWAPFLNSNDETVVVFSCLKRLYLEFSFEEATEKTDVTMPELLLKFPKLNSMSITCFHPLCPFFKMARFSNTMDDIYICAPPALLGQLKDVGMPTAKHVTMCS